MAKQRKASALWTGDLKSGDGLISTESQALYEHPYNFGTRFENAEDGSNPEELLAAAHAACFSMALAGTLKKSGYQPISINTRATCTITPLEEGGFEITDMDLHVRGEVEGLDLEAFRGIVAEADQGCPVSNLLREGLEISHDVELI
jgi:osmotically inducible protein OsmC